MNRWRASFLLICLLLSGWPVMAMEFRVLSEEERLTFIQAQGPIRLGDEERFIRLVGGLGRRVVLVVDSPGGNLAAADRMRGLVAGLNMAVVVPTGATCASACFLLFAAAKDRLIERGARIGVHSASVSAGENANTMAATVLMARVAREYAIPNAIVGRMVTTDPGQMAWLTDDEIASIPRTEFMENHPRSAALAPPPPASSAPSRPSTDAAAIASPLTGFARGHADRQMMDAWIAAQPPNVRAGIDWWAMRRSLPRPGECANPDPGFVEGCAEARRRLTPIDVQRRSDPEYRRGWNTP
ncbi:ATP-dependent Clp protease proteolytic subunit [Roseomonas sp. NAR14]|uniref:ATP-dependent Clp protease proteolytic subunit n=2 Tax=Roseomonas acroporae TaxID=2937791 RepID=A0A9X2C0L8_9PROT|nr:ATP-dependent Clp protease proteolytic subunit [Roseomonas acroporae]